MYDLLKTAPQKTTDPLWALDIPKDLKGLCKKGQYHVIVAHYGDIIKKTPGSIGGLFGVGLGFALQKNTTGLYYFDDAIRMANKKKPALARDAIFARANAYATFAKKPNDALLGYNKCIGFDKSFAEAYNNRGNLFFEKGDLNTACIDYDKALRRRPGYGDALYNKGNVMLSRKKYGKAINYYTKALEADSGLIDAHSNMAQALAMLNMTDEAIAACDKVLGVDEYHKYANYNAGALVMRKKNDPALAHTYFIMSLADDDTCADTHYNIGIVLAKLKRYDGAVNSFGWAAKHGKNELEFKEALKLAPTAEMHCVKAKHLIDYEKDYGGAVWACDNAIKINPKYAPAYYRRAQAYEMMGDVPNAMSNYDDAIKFGPTVPDVYNDRAGMLAGASNHRAAIDDYTKAIYINGNDYIYYFNRAFCYYELGDYDKSIKDYTECLLLKPDYVGALINKANVYSTMGDAHNASVLYKKALEIDPGNKTALKNIKIKDHKKMIRDTICS